MNNDMAILLVYFNPCRRKRLLMNHLYIQNKLLNEGLPVFTIEVASDNRNRDIPNSIKVNSNSYMFYKENAYRVLEKHIPNSYIKLAFLDNDVYFNSTRWYYTVSDMLNSYDVIQPFEYAKWLDITYKTQIRVRESIVKYKQYEYTNDVHEKYHVGFAWCMRREWYNTIGFFDYSILGSGDSTSVLGWLNIKIPDKSIVKYKCYDKYYTEFNKHKKPNIGFLEGEEIYHLYHGDLEKRNYYNRHKIIDSSIDSIDNIIYKNQYGIFEWIDKDKYNPLVYDYLKNRDDDSI